MDDKIAVVILSTGTSHKISQETYDQICMADVNDLVRLPNGATFKNSAVMDILSVEDFERQHPDKVFFDYHQPYTALPDTKQLPAGKGFEGIINSAPNKGLVLMIKGIKKFIDREETQGNKVPNASKLLKAMEDRLMQKSSRPDHK